MKIDEFVDDYFSLPLRYRTKISLKEYLRNWLLKNRMSMGEIEKIVKAVIKEWQADGAKAIKNDEARTSWTFIPADTFRLAQAIAQEQDRRLGL